MAERASSAPSWKGRLLAAVALYVGISAATAYVQADIIRAPGYTFAENLPGDLAAFAVVIVFTLLIGYVIGAFHE